MVGNAIESELAPVRPAVRFEKATAAHDPAIRRLLRENPFAGDISISLETEPDHALAAAVQGSEHYTVVASEAEKVICVGTVSARERFVNGQAIRIGYLSGLRLDASCRRRVSILRNGYDFFFEMHRQSGPALYLTSIIADNAPARRLLERGLPGMPTYRYLEDFHTLIIPVNRRPNDHALARLRRQGIEVRSGRDQNLEQVADFLNTSNKRYQFAPQWSARDLCSQERCPGLRPDDFLIARCDGDMVACAALWDQRSFRQTVVRSFSRRILRLRWLLNILPGVPRLPCPGIPLAQGVISHVATKDGYESVLPMLISLLNVPARARGLDFLTVGFSVRDPRLPLVYRRLHGRRYPSRLYAVYWPDGADAADALDERIASPEVALL